MSVVAGGIQPGDVLAERFRIRRRLGAGGTATVFLAEDCVLCRDVAIKRLHPEGSEADIRRFRREARLGAALVHPNLVTVFDTLSSSDGVLIVMEYVRGRPLSDLIALGRHGCPAPSRDPPSGGRRVGPCPPARGGPPRRKAGERPDRGEQGGQAGRPGHRDGRPHDADHSGKRGDGNARLHRSRATCWRVGGRAGLRRLLPGRARIRGIDGNPPIARIRRASFCTEYFTTRRPISTTRRPGPRLDSGVCWHRGWTRTRTDDRPPPVRWCAISRPRLPMGRTGPWPTSTGPPRR